MNAAEIEGLLERADAWVEEGARCAREGVAELAAALRAVVVELEETKNERDEGRERLRSITGDNTYLVGNAERLRVEVERLQDALRELRDCFPLDDPLKVANFIDSALSNDSGVKE